MTQDDRAQDVSEHVTAGEAAQLLEIGDHQIQAMVEEGLLTPIGSDPIRFSHAEVLAVRNLGG
jgi:hypothetical protein